MFMNSVAGSFLLGFGCALNISTQSAPPGGWFQVNAPGLLKTLSACFFPVGLIMCFLTGADLFTSYCMVGFPFIFPAVGVDEEAGWLADLR
jgi:formate/nitrite transporter FocA (FNT family)